MTLLTTNNTKLRKGNGRGYMSFVLHLSPADSSGTEVCPKRSPGCTAACLNTAGRWMPAPRGSWARCHQPFTWEDAAYAAHCFRAAI